MTGFVEKCIHNITRSWKTCSWSCHFFYTATSSELMVLNSKRQMSLTSDISAESEEGDLVGPNGIIPQERQASINGALLSPTDSEPCRLSFSHSSIPHKTSRRSFSRQETAISLRSHSSQVNVFLLMFPVILSGESCQMFQYFVNSHRILVKTFFGDKWGLDNWFGNHAHYYSNSSLHIAAINHI